MRIFLVRPVSYNRSVLDAEAAAERFTQQGAPASCCASPTSTVPTAPLYLR